MRKVQNQDRRCLICKYRGVLREDRNLSRAEVFNRSGDPVRIYLCRAHDYDLFKLGQNRFILKFHTLFEDSLGNDDMKFFKVVNYVLSKQMANV